MANSTDAPAAPPVAHPDYERDASELARLLTADLAEIPSVVLERYLAPVARKQIRELEHVGQRTDRARPRTSTGRRKALDFWTRLDAYCEAEIRERRAAAAAKQTPAQRAANEALAASPEDAGDVR